MSDLSPELNLVLAVDDDDTADYLDAPTNSLRSSLLTIDGLFNSSTGHTHNGAHQGGALQFQNLTVGATLTVVGASILQGAVQAQSTLTVSGNTSVSTISSSGLATLNSLDVTTTSRLRGTITADGALNVGGNLTVTGTSSHTGAATFGGVTASTLSVTGSASITAATLTSPTINGTIGGSATFSNGPFSNDWFRNSVAYQGLFNSVHNQGYAYANPSGLPADYASGAIFVTQSRTETLSNKTFSSSNAINLKQQGASGYVTTTNDLTNYMFAYGTGTYTLPVPAPAYVGVFRAIKAWGGVVTVNCGAAALIGPGATAASSSFTLQNGDSVTCWSDGSYWWIL